MQIMKEAVRTAAVVLTIVVSTPVVHALLGRVFVTEASITGEPNIPLLLAVVCVQAVLMVQVFKVVRAHLPGGPSWLRGLAFGALFLLSVQIPSVFGIIAFEPGADWQLFTDAKVANHVTLLGDTLVWSAVGALIGLLFGGNGGRGPRPSARLWWATAAGAVVFPLGLWAVMHLAFGCLPVSDPNAPVGRSLWFDLVFYGVFFMTGACLPWLHAVARRSSGAAGLRSALRTTGLFALVWLPVQNFMVVFGWEMGGALVFSSLSMIPVFAVVWLAEGLMSAVTEGE
jgi:hypothetical protein